MRRSAYFRLSAVAAASLAAAAIAPGWAAPAGARFTAPVQVTPANTGGYEPGIYTGPGNTLVMTAHKENAQLGLAPDPNSTTQTRSMSWAWVSTDGGQHWGDLPLGPADAQNHEFGDEGDMVFDDASNLYFVDTTVADVTFTSWHEANGHYQFVYNTPILGAAQAVDDRPWIAAHNNGDVFYFGNEGDKDTNPTGATNAGPGSGVGRYTVYHSTDGGKTWDHLGIQLKDSGWCRPAAGPHSNYVYALCTNDAGADDEIHNPGDAGYTKGMLYAYVSADDGKTWNRYTAGTYNARDSWTSYPSIQVARDGSLWGSYLDGVTNKTCSSTCAPETAHFKVMHSTDHGKHWTTYDATPTGAKGLQFRYSWLSVANDGKSLGMAVYARKFTGAGSEPWYVYAATFKAGQHPTLVSLDPKEPVADAGYGAPGDFLMVTHDAKGKLHVAWTRATRYVPMRGSNSKTALRDIFTASQR
ncbi:MAG: repeat-like domain [Frankiaceae bacterium]|nr:repeat-like domain [Frankiaceae bacterium]